ncbi:hypothetical protein HDU92_008389, partial [Lobulomyces angularis]
LRKKAMFKDIINKLELTYYQCNVNQEKSSNNTIILNKKSGVVYIESKSIFTNGFVGLKNCSSNNFMATNLTTKVIDNSSNVFELEDCPHFF